MLFAELAGSSLLSLSFKPAVAIHRKANSGYSQESRMVQHLAITLVKGAKNFMGSAL